MCRLVARCPCLLNTPEGPGPRIGFGRSTGSPLSTRHLPLSLVDERRWTATKDRSDVGPSRSPSLTPSPSLGPLGTHPPSPVLCMGQGGPKRDFVFVI